MASAGSNPAVTVRKETGDYPRGRCSRFDSCHGNKVAREGEASINKRLNIGRAWPLMDG